MTQSFIDRIINAHKNGKTYYYGNYKYYIDYDIYNYLKGYWIIRINNATGTHKHIKIVTIK